MPRAEPVTQDAVFAACEALTAENTKPTLENVRGKTGGSYNTLSPLLKAWRNQQTSQAAAVLEMPDSVLVHLKGLAAELWKTASAEAAARTKSIEEAAEQRAADAETEAAELAGAVQRLEAELATVQATAEASAQELEQVAKTLAALKDESARDQAQLLAAREMLEKSNARNDQLHDELIALARDVAGKG